MAWTGFGGQWNNGVHSGGDDSGSIGGGGIKLDGKGNPVGTRAPTAEEIASQWNSFGGSQIKPSDVSNIRPDGEGTYQANIAGNYHVVSSQGANTPFASERSNVAAGFSGGVGPTPDGRGNNSAPSNPKAEAEAKKWIETVKAVRAGNIPYGYVLNDGKVGVNVPQYVERRKGRGDTYTVRGKDLFVVSPELTKAYQDGLAERAEILDAVKFTSDFYKDLAGKFGQHNANIAKELAEAAKGKKIRNSKDALAAVDKFNNRLSKKYGAKDLEAVARALESVNRDAMAKNLSKFGKAFGVASYAVDAYNVLYVEFPKAIRTKNYRPMLVKLEAILLGADAGIVAAWAFSALLATPMGILTFALIMALLSAMINEKRIEELNKFLGI